MSSKSPVVVFVCALCAMAIVIFILTSGSPSSSPSPSSSSSKKSPPSSSSPSSSPSPPKSPSSSPTDVDPVTGCVKNWKYGDSSTVITGCGSPDKDPKKWCMKPAYKSSGIAWAWKYTDDPNDPDCLRNWTYYDADNKVIEANIPSITMSRDTKNWCPVNKYVAGNGALYFRYC